MTFSREMLKLKNDLIQRGHKVIIPPFTKEYAKMDEPDKRHTESARNKVEHDLIKGYYNEIKKSDAILILNKQKKGLIGYIGGNSFLEMGFAYILNKKIFLMNPIPKRGYTDEIQAMQPTILNRNLSLLK